MVHRIWQEGSLTVDRGRPLDAVRRTVLTNAEACRYDLANPSDTEHADPERLDLAFTWNDDEVNFSTLLALRVSPADPRCVDWLLATACTRPWQPLFPSVSRHLGLDDDLNALDRGGQDLHSPKILSGFGLDPRKADQFGDAVAHWINNPVRTLGYLVIPDDSHPRYVNTAGLVMGIAVDDVGRRAITERLPTRPIPAGQTRLFMPACDGLPDIVAPNSRLSLHTDLVEGIHRLLLTRQRTPLPPRWHDDPTLRAWWGADPFTIRAPRPVAEADPTDLPTADRLREALHQITILRKQNKSIQDALAEANERNKTLQQQLADHVDHLDLKAQLVAAQEELDRTASDLDEVETERDALRRHNGLLIAQLAQAGTGVDPNDDQEAREFTSFAELLQAASTELPGLVVTADPAPATALDHHPKAPAWRRKAWDALRTLHAYVTARTTADAPSGTHADVRTFARTGQPGSLISANIIKMGESETVMQQRALYQARVFPVRTETDPSGRAFFGAHIALERYKNPAPRLHFLDDVARNEVLYVGYLGEHLPNTKTN